MLNFEILPRLIPDTYVDTMEEALDEVAKRRMGSAAADSLTRIVESPYGGFRVFSVSRTLAIELFTAMADSQGLPPDMYSARRTVSR